MNDAQGVALPNQHRGSTYGLSLDGDFQTWNFRTDLFGDAAEQSAFTAGTAPALIDAGYKSMAEGRTVNDLKSQRTESEETHVPDRHPHRLFPYGLKEVAQRIPSHGFNTVQLDLHFKDIDLSYGQITKDKAKLVRDTFRNHNLPICCRENRDVCRVPKIADCDPACCQSNEPENRGRTMRKITTSVFLALMLVAGCGDVAGSRVEVKGTGDEEFLKLRAGPGLGYKATLGLPDGTLLTRSTCVTELGQLWCKVSLEKAPGITGYVSADYLSER